MVSAHLNHENANPPLVRAGVRQLCPFMEPFFTEKDLVFDPALAGTWRPVEAKDNSKESWAFTRRGDKLHQLQQTDEEGRQAAFDARLFKLNGQLFLDLHLTKVEGDDLKVNAWASISLVPAHLLLKVERIEPALKLAAMNPDWMQKHLKQHPEAVAHRVVSGGNIVLAASTGELQKFVLAHLEDKEFFGGAMEMKRKQDTTLNQERKTPCPSTNTSAGSATRSSAKC
jgi:hypothetical protein